MMRRLWTTAVGSESLIEVTVKNHLLDGVEILRVVEDEPITEDSPDLLR